MFIAYSIQNTSETENPRYIYYRHIYCEPFTNEKLKVHIPIEMGKKPSRPIETKNEKFCGI